MDLGRQVKRSTFSRGPDWRWESRRPLGGCCGVRHSGFWRRFGVDDWDGAAGSATWSSVWFQGICGSTSHLAAMRKVNIYWELRAIGKRHDKAMAFTLVRPSRGRS